jgi:hypothetical protein
MEPDRPHHDRPDVCVIAQQYSFPTLTLFHKKKFGAHFTSVIISIIYIFLYLRMSDTV